MLPEYTLKQWAMTLRSEDAYRAPEACGRYLKGHVFGHPKYEDNSVIVTSGIVSVSGRKITTKRSVYVLDGDPHPTYSQWLEENGFAYDPEQPIKVVKKLTPVPNPNMAK